MSKFWTFVYVWECPIVETRLLVSLDGNILARDLLAKIAPSTGLGKGKFSQLLFSFPVHDGRPSLNKIIGPREINLPTIRKFDFQNQGWSINTTYIYFFLWWTSTSCRCTRALVKIPKSCIFLYQEWVLFS